MGILSKIGDKIKESYRNIDQKLGGILPGGAPKNSPQPSPSQSPSPSPAAPSQTKSQTPTVSSGSKGSSSSGSKGSAPQDEGYYYELDTGKVYSKPNDGEEFKPVTTPISMGGRTIKPSKGSSSNQSDQVVLGEADRIQPGVQPEAPAPTVRFLSPDQNAKRVRDFISSNQADNVLQGFDSGMKSAALLGIGFSAYNPLIGDVYGSYGSRRKSMMAPAPQEIIDLGNSGYLSGSEVKQGVGFSLNQMISSTYEREFNDYIDQLAGSQADQLSTKRKSYQARIDAGEDFANVNLEYAQDVANAQDLLSTQIQGFGSKWYSERGINIERQANKVLKDTNLLFDIKGIQEKVPSYLGKGAIAGAAVTGGLLVAGTLFPPLGAAEVGVAGGILAGGYAAYEFGKAGLTGYREYKEDVGLGFSKNQAFQRALLASSGEIAPAAFSSAGAAAGGAAVYYGYRGIINLRNTGRVTGFSPEERDVIKRITSRPDAFQAEFEKGRVLDVTDTLYSGGRSGSVQSGATLRKYSLSLNTEGLSAEELAVANKLNYRGIAYQYAYQRGKVLSGYDLTETKIGGFLGRKTVSFSEFSGGLNNEGYFAGLRFELAKTGNIYEVSLGELYGKGNVRYTEEGLRAEVSDSISRRVGSYVFKDTTGLIEIGGRRFDLIGKRGASPFYESKQGIGSILTDAEISFQNFGFGNAGLKVTKGYTDILSQDFGDDLKILIERRPGRSMKGFGSGGSVPGSMQGQEQSINQILKEITAPAPPASFQAPGEVSSRSIFSPYAGSGIYERQDFEMGFARGKMKGDFSFGGYIAPPIIFEGLMQKEYKNSGEILPGASGSGAIIRSGQIPFVDTLPKIDQDFPPILDQRTQQTQKLLAPPLRGGRGFGFNPLQEFPEPLIPGLPDLPGIDFGGLSSGEIPQGAQRFKYVPDFKSLIFGITGRAPSGGAAPSPFADRPIPKGFSLAFEEGFSFQEAVNQWPGMRKRRKR